MRSIYGLQASPMPRSSNSSTMEQGRLELGRSHREQRRRRGERSRRGERGRFYSGEGFGESKYGVCTSRLGLHESEKLAGYLFYHTSASGDEQARLADHMAHMKENQRDIY